MQAISTHFLLIVPRGEHMDRGTGWNREPNRNRPGNREPEVPIGPGPGLNFLGYLEPGTGWNRTAEPAQNREPDRGIQMKRQLECPNLLVINYI